MDLEELFPSKPDDPLVALARQDLDPLSVDELKERIEAPDVRRRQEGVRTVVRSVLHEMAGPDPFEARTANKSANCSAN